MADDMPTKILLSEDEQPTQWYNVIADLPTPPPPPLPPPATLRTTLRPYQQRGLEWLAHLSRQRIGGVLAIAGVTVALGVALSAAATQQWRKAGALVVAALAVLGLAVVAPSGKPTVEEIDVAFVQGGGPQGTGPQ